jgi:hypothetical protein
MKLINILAFIAYIAICIAGILATALFCLSGPLATWVLETKDYSIVVLAWVMTAVCAVVACGIFSAGSKVNLMSRLLELCVDGILRICVVFAALFTFCLLLYEKITGVEPDIYTSIAVVCYIVCAVIAIIASIFTLWNVVSIPAVVIIFVLGTFVLIKRELTIA